MVCRKADSEGKAVPGLTERAAHGRPHGAHLSTYFLLARMILCGMLCTCCCFSNAWLGHIILISRGPLFAGLARDRAGLSLSGDDVTTFHPTCERFAPPLPSAEQLAAATGAPQLPAALAPDPNVGPAQARNADRRMLQSGEEVAPSRLTELVTWLVAE